jgi:signal transduction histidine kinase
MERLDTSSDFVLTRLKVADLLKELDRTMRPLADKKQIAFTLEVADDLKLIRGQRKELITALSHIIENAIQYTPSDGNINIRAYASDDSVIVEVVDTGIGISEADLPRIFERFYRVDQARTGRGAGLGLSIAKKIIEIHNGRIEVVSAPNQGSTFKVILPRS